MRAWPVSASGGGIHSVRRLCVSGLPRRNVHDLTLTTYAEQETENPLPEPVAAVAETNVVDLFG